MVQVKRARCQTYSNVAGRKVESKFVGYFCRGLVSLTNVIRRAAHTHTRRRTSGICGAHVDVKQRRICRASFQPPSRYPDIHPQRRGEDINFKT